MHTISTSQAYLAGGPCCSSAGFSPQSTFWALCPDLVGHRRAGTATGVMNFFAYLFACSPGLGADHRTTKSRDILSVLGGGELCRDELPRWPPSSGDSVNQRAPLSRKRRGRRDGEPLVRRWLGEATSAVLSMAGIAPGSHALDVAAGTGDQTLDIAERVGPRDARHEGKPKGNAACFCGP
jgi:hypothetical protein